MRSNGFKPSRTIGRVTIGLASVAVAATTFGAASASAAAVAHPVGNGASLVQHILHTPIKTYQAAMPGAYAPGGKGSPGKGTCAGFNKAIQKADGAYLKAAGKGNVNAAASAAGTEVAALNGAENAGCVVIWPA